MGPPIHFQTLLSFSFLYFLLFLRYIGSMVADVHRTLKYGGIFMYPATGFLFNLQNFNIPIFALPSIEPKWQTASALRVHAHGLHHRTGGGHCQHWAVSSNKKLFHQRKCDTFLLYIGNRFWTSLPRNFMKEARSSWVVVTMSTTYQSSSRRTEKHEFWWIENLFNLNLRTQEFHLCTQ